MNFFFDITKIILIFGVLSNYEVLSKEIGVDANQTPTSIPESCLNTIRYKKCLEYGEAVNEKVENILQNGTVQNMTIDKCPQTIFNQFVSPKEFPHSAMLGFQKENGSIAWSCGGSLISDRYVITAAHCLNSRELGNVKFVRLGDMDLQSESDDARPETFNVIERIPHPKHTRRTYYHDLALIRLDRQVVFNPYIRPICLPLTKTIASDEAIISGWCLNGWAGALNPSLYKETVDIITYNACNASYQHNINRRLPIGIIDDQICAGIRGERNPCITTGNPLQNHNTIHCMFNLLGIGSFGKSCGVDNSPDVYTRVSGYVDWIESVVWSGEITVPNCEQS